MSIYFISEFNNIVYFSTLNKNISAYQENSSVKNLFSYFLLSSHSLVTIEGNRAVTMTANFARMRNSIIRELGKIRFPETGVR